MNPDTTRGDRPHFPYHATHGRIEAWDFLGDRKYRTAWLTLAACPFCGGQDLSVCEPLAADDSRNPMHSVVCPECGCTGPWAKSEELAIRFWNTWNNTSTRQLSEWQYHEMSVTTNDSVF